MDAVRYGFKANGETEESVVIDPAHGMHYPVGLTGDKSVKTPSQSQKILEQVANNKALQQQAIEIEETLIDTLTTETQEDVHPEKAAEEIQAAMSTGDRPETVEDVLYSGVDAQTAQMSEQVRKAFLLLRPTKLPKNALLNAAKTITQHHVDAEAQVLQHTLKTVMNYETVLQDWRLQYRSAELVPKMRYNTSTETYDIPVLNKKGQPVMHYKYDFTYEDPTAKHKKVKFVNRDGTRNVAAEYASKHLKAQRKLLFDTNMNIVLMTEMLGSEQRGSFMSKHIKICKEMQSNYNSCLKNFMVKKVNGQWQVNGLPQEIGAQKSKRRKSRKQGADEAAPPKPQDRQWTPFGALLAASKQQYDGLQRTRSAALGRQAPATRRAPPSTTPPVGSASWMARMGL